MILVDKDIMNYVNSKQLIIEGFDKNNLGSVSYDLTVDTIFAFNGLNKSEEKKEYELSPGEAIFIKSKEKLMIPEKILGRIAQKNSKMRMGLYVDGPHYHPGHVTYAYLRIQNMSSNVININSGDKIAQILFEELNSKPNKQYNSPNDAFANETSFRGLSSYKNEYINQIKKIEKVQSKLEDKEAQIYTNVLTLMGIIAAVFSLITINFQVFASASIDLKFLLTMNLSLAFAISVFFGLLYLITNKQKCGKFCFIYISILLLVVVLIVLVNRYL